MNRLGFLVWASKEDVDVKLPITVEMLIDAKVSMGGIFAILLSADDVPHMEVVVELSRQR